jgi:antitoxin (DNA-binding transcriptional repressor) of toxin-antitoxin stability system
MVATSSYNQTMRAVGVKVLKDKLSEYLRIAESGETVLVTDRDKVIAELRAPSVSWGAELADVCLADLVRRGVLRPPLLGAGAGPPPRRPVLKSDELMEQLAQDRADRWST